MPIPIECPSCHSKYNAPDKALHRSVPCPKCATPIVVEPSEARDDEYELADPEPVEAATNASVPNANATRDEEPRDSHRVDTITNSDHSWFGETKRQIFANQFTAVASLNVICWVVVVLLTLFSPATDLLTLGFAILVAVADLALAAIWVIYAFGLWLGNAPLTNVLGCSAVLFTGAGFVRHGKHTGKGLKFFGLSLVALALAPVILLVAAIFIDADRFSEKAKQPPAHRPAPLPRHAR